MPSSFQRVSRLPRGGRPGFGNRKINSSKQRVERTPGLSPQLPGQGRQVKREQTRRPAGHRGGNRGVSLRPRPLGCDSAAAHGRRAVALAESSTARGACGPLCAAPPGTQVSRCGQSTGPRAAGPLPRPGPRLAVARARSGARGPGPRAGARGQSAARGRTWARSWGWSRPPPRWRTGSWAPGC